MEALKIVKHYIEDTTEARFYTDRAEQAVREYLGYSATDPLDAFSSSVASIALDFWRIDAASGSEAGRDLKGESYEEGDVKHSLTYGSASEAAEKYRASIEATLLSLRQHKKNRGKVVFI